MGFPEVWVVEAQTEGEPHAGLGLPGYVIRNAKAASRLLAAKAPDTEAERRRDAVARWREAMGRGLSADAAAAAVGCKRSSLYRWEKRPESRSKRPKRLRAKGWTPALVEAVDHPTL